MAALASVFVEVLPKTDKFAPQLQTQLNKVDTSSSAKKAGSRWGGAFSKAAGAFAAIGILKFGKDSVVAFKDAEVAQTRLTDAFAKFPKLADVSIGSLQKYNQELAKKTRFDDDATASGQAVLAQFGLTGTQIRTLTPLLQDYAAKTGKDLPTAARDLGKAVLGQGRALKAVGLNLKDTGSATGNTAQLTAGLRKQVGGFAEKEGKTAAGQTAILGNQFGELQEQVGEGLVPMLTKLIGKLLAMVDFVQRNKDVLIPLGVAVLGVAVAVKTASAVTATWTTVTKLATVATKAWTAAQWLLNVAMRANPIGIVITLITALVVGIVIAYKRSETFRRIVKLLWDGLRLGALTAVSFVLSMIDKWLGALQTALSFMGKLRGPFGAPFRAMAAGVEIARGKVKELKDGVDRLKPKTVPVTVAIRGVDVTALPANAGIRFGGTGRLAAAYGGRIPGYSPGDRSDNVPARLTAGEYVIQRPTVRKLDARVPGFLDKLNSGRLDIGGDPDVMRVGVGRSVRQTPRGFADGGLVRRVQAHLKAQAGEPYIWGGVGPYGGDCSGYVGQAYGLLTGRAPYRRYFTTASIGGAQGFKPGKGTFTVGVTAGSGHMAGNLGGLAFESTPPRIRVGASAAPVSRFARQFYLPSAGGTFGGMPELTRGQRSSVVRQMRPRIVADIFRELGVRQFDSGGWMNPGQLGINLSSRPERVRTGGQEDALAAAIRVLGEQPVVVQLDGREIARTVRNQNTRNPNGW